MSSEGQEVHVKATTGQAPWGVLYCPRCPNAISSGYEQDFKYQWSLKLKLCRLCVSSQRTQPQIQKRGSSCGSVWRTPSGTHSQHACPQGDIFFNSFCRKAEAAGKLWYASCYGAFGNELGRDVQLEQMYMEMCEYSYRVTEDRRKCCFARTILGQRKTDIIKMINRASEKTHQGLIQMKRLSEEIDEKTKFKKQKKGTTLGGFVKLDGQVKYKPQQAVASVKHKIDEKR
jgi:hypothetical protein